MRWQNLRGDFALPAVLSCGVGTKLQHLVDGLNLQDASHLRRMCDRPTDKRGAAAPLWWTMGAQQVGTAALSAWQELILPLVACELECGLWPFDGGLDKLKKHALVVAEVYPAEMYGHDGLEFPVINEKLTGKRSQVARQANSEKILAIAKQINVAFGEACQNEILAGFGDQPDGEDRFDALLRLLGMLLVLEGDIAEGIRPKNKYARLRMASRFKRS